PLAVQVDDRLAFHRLDGLRLDAAQPLDRMNRKCEVLPGALYHQKPVRGDRKRDREMKNGAAAVSRLDMRFTLHPADGFVDYREAHSAAGQSRDYSRRRKARLEQNSRERVMRLVRGVSVRDEPLLRSDVRYPSEIHAPSVVLDGNG